eukprot:scaffold1088_cov58-Phaeocystis_antarctica.AAC.1
MTTYSTSTLTLPDVTYSTHQSPAKLYLVMDYCNGGELFFHLKQARYLVNTPHRLGLGRALLPPQAGTATLRLSWAEVT